MSSSEKKKTGYFLFSLDTELAWGYYDRFHENLFSLSGKKEREAVRRLLEIFDEFNITATWAVVGHLFYEKCENCEICPVREWEYRYRSFDEIYKTENQLWYGLDIINLLQTKGSRHEIAFHGYTHRVFSEEKMIKQDAKIEIEEWQRVASRKNVTPYSVIFPRNRIGHLQAFKDAGYICFRGDELHPKDYKIPFIGKILNRIDLILQIRTPQIYELIVDDTGLINFPSSRWLFGMNRKIESVLDAFGLHLLRIRKIVKAVKKSAQEGKIIHIWAHPEEFKTEKDFEKLRFLLSYVSEEVKKGTIQSVGMADLARWTAESVWKNQ
jgi:hypothetical protein